MPVGRYVVCPHCHQQLQVTGVAGGSEIQCPKCRGMFRVPDVVPSDPAPWWRLRMESGKVYGPVSRDELMQWIRERRVHAGCQVSPADSEQWMWVGERFPELASRLVAAPAPVTPVPTGSVAPVSSRSRLVAGLLGLLFPLVGLNGIHRFYTGHIWLGVLMLITCGGCGIWQLIDVILVFSGTVCDAQGLPLRE